MLYTAGGAHEKISASNFSQGKIHFSPLQIVQPVLRTCKLQMRSLLDTVAQG